MDLSHHINRKSKARHPSPLKDIIKFMGYEGMISLAGGLPHPSLFPIKSITVHATTPESHEAATNEIAIGEGAQVPLADFLQYGNAAGNTELRKWCHDFTKQVHRPAREDFEVLMHPGNTNAWSKVVGLLLEDDDHVLCEEFTYPSAQALWIPSGNHAVPIALDAEGMRADLLEDCLANWEATHPGKRRPHVVYLVPVGSNPSGVTYSAKRKQELYDICVKYDIIIVEDDPYFFLQFPASKLDDEPKYELIPQEDFLASLSPSFLRLDHQGRVIRLESFSKTLAPGLRLGYFIANTLFTERLLRASEVETQDPSGASQAVVLALLKTWTPDGFLKWMQHIRIQYQQRRDWMVGAFRQHFDLVPAEQYPELHAEGLVAVMTAATTTTTTTTTTQDPAKRVPIFSFVPPTGGMFIWAMFYLSSNMAFRRIRMQGNSLDPEETFAKQLWEQLAEELVLLTPGSYYHPWQGREKTTTLGRGAEAGVTQFRFSFAYTTKEDMEQGIERFANVVRRSWG